MLSNQKKYFLELLVILLLIFSVSFLVSQTLITYGVLKERQDKECVGATQILSWEKSLKLAEEICVNGRNEIRQIYEDKIRKAEDETIKWKNSYNWIKKQTASSTNLLN